MEGLAVVLALAALAIALVALGLAIRMERRPDDLSPGGARTSDLERHLRQLIQRMDAVESELDAQRTGSAPTSRVSTTPLPRGTAAISRIGLVRFDAFEDAGGAQSFALALVDDDGDGVVISSLHSRPTTRVYIKAIRRGVADAPLSTEETRALQDAGITPTT
jgi:Protein of unknown function (DUF4446)